MGKKPPPLPPSLGETFGPLTIQSAIHVEDDPAIPRDVTLKDMMPTDGYDTASAEDHVYRLMIDLLAKYYVDDHTVPMSQLSGDRGGPYEIMFLAFPYADTSIAADGTLAVDQYRADLMDSIMTMWADLSVVAHADIELHKEDNYCWASSPSAPAWVRALERLVAYKDFPAPEKDRGELMLTQLPALHQAVVQEFGEYIPPGQKAIFQPSPKVA